MARREFNPKSFLILFLSLSLTILFLFLGSSYTTKVYSDLFEEEKYGIGVKVGPISIEGLTQEEAKKQIVTKVSDWEKEAAIQLSYIDKKTKFDTGAFLFNIDKSLNGISTKAVPLVVELDEEVVGKTVEALNVTGLEQLLNKEMLVSHLKQTAAQLQTDVVIDVNEFLTTFGQSEEVISESSIKMPGEHLLLESWLKGLEGYEIKPGVTFSLQQAIEEKGMTAQDSIDLNVLASGIYMAVQKTNFPLIERHTSRELPDYTTLGYEAYVKPADMDLAFQNPNATTYTLRFLVVEGALKTTIVGVPLPYTYKIKIDKQVFKPKTIIHFNDQLANIFSSVVVNSGSEGYLAMVYRESYGSGGELVESSKLAEDFYPPKHRIEERGYPIEEEEINENPAYAPYPWYPYPAVPWNPAIPPLPEGILPEMPVEQPETEEDTVKEEETKPQANLGEENGGDAK